MNQEPDINHGSTILSPPPSRPHVLDEWKAKTLYVMYCGRIRHLDNTYVQFCILQWDLKASLEPAMFPSVSGPTSPLPWPSCCPAPCSPLHPPGQPAFPRGALLVRTRPQGGGGGDPPPSTDPKIVARNKVLCRRRRRRRFCFRHTAGGIFLVPPYVSILKILRILWRIQKWLKSTKKVM